MRIGIDIDGVLTDVEKYQIDIGSKVAFLKYNKEFVHRDSFKLSEMFNTKENVDDTFWDLYLYDYCINEPARKCSAEVINKLKEDGNEIYIITARIYANKNDEKGIEMQNIVKNWLNKYNIYYDKIIFCSEDKVDICLKNNIDLMIEDNPDNILGISRNFPVICYDAEYNRKCNGENIIRCYSWYDIYAKIQKMVNKIGV